MTAQQPEQPFQIRSLGLSVYLPTFLFAVGQGAVIPFTPLLAREMGASVALASLIVAIRGVGMMVFDIPAGIMVGRIGERYSMVVGSVMLLVVGIGAALTQSPIVFAILMVLTGFAWSIWQLARLAYVSDQAPPEMRGRALSLVGGTNRVGNFVGPFVGGAVAVSFGLSATFYVQAILAILASAFMFALMRGGDTRGAEAGHGSHSFTNVIRTNRKIFATAGLAVVCLGVLRASRQTIIPLWGEHIGLSEASIGAVFGASNGIDMLLFYPTGMVMDRFGRKWVAVPCLTVLAIGLMFIPFATTELLFVLVAMFTGLGNGMGAGIVMTLGADFSPATRRAEFLGVWRLIGDIGQTGGPLLLSGLTAVATLGIASVATGVIGLLGALVMYLFVVEPLPPRANVPKRTAASPPG